MKAKHILGILATPIVGVTSLLAPVSCNEPKTEFDVITQQFYENCIYEIQRIAEIPHPSDQAGEEADDNLQAIREYLVNKIDTYMGTQGTANVDQARNVWFDIQPTPGYESQKAIILQAHMDMVFAKKDEWKHEKLEPISPPVIDIINGRKVMHTQGYLTSQGTDDAQGMAILLSLAKFHDSIPHCKIRCLFTANEETTSSGAKNANPDIFQGINYLTNLDSPHGGKIVTTSAGIAKWTHTITIQPSNNMNSNAKLYKIELSDFTGGHSGEDVDSPRVSPIKLLIKELSDLTTKHLTMKMQLANLTTTAPAHNVIPSDATAWILSEEPLSSWKNELENTFKNDIKPYSLDKNAKIKIEEISGEYMALSEEQTNRFLRAIRSLPCGAQNDMRFSDDNFIGGSGNIAPFTWTKDGSNLKINFKSSYRFGSAEWGESLRGMSGSVEAELKRLFPNEYICDHGEETPVWEHKENNPLAKLCYDSHKKFNLGIKYIKCHGALEPSHFAKKDPSNPITQISIGATIDNEHNVRETLYLDEYLNLCGVLLDMIKNMNI